MTESLFNINFELTNTIIGIPVPLHEYDRIGIAMSGGMDSMVLAEELLATLDHNKVTIYTVDLKNSVDTVRGLLKALEFSGNHVVLPDPKNVNGALSPQFLDVCKTVDYFYTGITMNPPWADSVPDGQKPHRFNKVRYENMFMPFGLATKRDVLELALNGLLEDLLELTHTCTERPHGEKSCGVCFACRERIWAFDELGVPDTVVYE